MAFKADAVKIKRWRQERHWSQEHLADVAGIGIRTVQRIENGGKASQESMMALAAAFNVDVFALSIDPETEAAEIVNHRYRKSMAALRLSLWIHLAGYLCGVIVLTAVGTIIDDQPFVMQWPLIAWTMAIATHAAAVVIIELVMRYHHEFQRAE